VGSNLTAPPQSEALSLGIASVEKRGLCAGDVALFCRIKAYYIIPYTHAFENLFGYSMETCQYGI
jgi:hypothetical protein